MTKRHDEKLRVTGGRIARRSLQRAERMWRIHQYINRLRGKGATTPAFLDYLIKRTKHKGRVTSLVGLRVFTSLFTIKEQEEAAKEPLRALLAGKIGDAHVIITTFSEGTNILIGPPTWRTGWCVEDARAQR
jgi:hypothetical protein